MSHRSTRSTGVSDVTRNTVYSSGAEISDVDYVTDIDDASTKTADSAAVNSSNYEDLNSKFDKVIAPPRHTPAPQPADPGAIERTGVNTRPRRRARHSPERRSSSRTDGTEQSYSGSSTTTQTQSGEAMELEWEMRMQQVITKHPLRTTPRLNRSKHFQNNTLFNNTVDVERQREMRMREELNIRPTRCDLCFKVRATLTAPHRCIHVLCTVHAKVKQCPVCKLYDENRPRENQ